MKKKLLVSFSGGETSAYMAQWLWNNKQDEYDMIFVFANTGLENEETLRFVNKCERLFSLTIVWVEASVYLNQKKSSGFKITEFHSASRNGEPFEDVISKYGIPNQNRPHCTRELKNNPIKAYANSIGWNNYYLAIGIREDETRRVNRSAKSFGIIYPLIDMRPMTKTKINFWWSQQPFRLELKGYQGNCITCWKKSDHKLFQIAKDSKSDFDFFKKMELKYGHFVANKETLSAKGKSTETPIRFFRNNRSADDIIESSKKHTGVVYDDSRMYDNQTNLLEALSAHGLSNESCEVFTGCDNQ